MDAAQHERAALVERGECQRHEGAHGSKYDRGVEEVRRLVLGRSRPFRAEFAREFLGRIVALAREGEHLLPMKDGELRHDVRGGSEAIDAETLCVAHQIPSAVADQTGAHQRCGLGIGVKVGNREGIVGSRGRKFGIAAIEGVAGELRSLAQVLALRAAEAAAAAGRAEPRYADAVADLEPGDPGSDRNDAADDLVPGYDVGLGVLQLAIDHVQIGAADPASGNADQDLPALGGTDVALDLDERPAGPIERHGDHARGIWRLGAGRRRFGSCCQLLASVLAQPDGSAEASRPGRSAQRDPVSTKSAGFEPGGDFLPRALWL